MRLVVRPNPAALPQGCRFAPRCAFRIPQCEAALPPLVEVDAGHEAACIRQAELVGP